MCSTGTSQVIVYWKVTQKKTYRLIWRAKVRAAPVPTVLHAPHLTPPLKLWQE